MHIPENLLDQGRDFLASLEIVNHKREEKGLWLFRWKGNFGGETEVLIGRKNVKAYSCDCQDFQDRKMCAHVSGAILHIHDVQETEKVQRKNQNETTAIKSPKIHLKHIVNQLSEKELRQFLLDQASKNPLIAGELKAQFAHKVEVPNADDKYFQVIKNYTTALAQGKINEHKFKKLAVYLTNLTHHGEDLSSEKNYREAVLILIGLVKFLGQYASRYRLYPWADLSLLIHQFLDKLYRQELPPSFKSGTTDKLRSIYLQETYLIFDEQYNLFTQLYFFSLDLQEAIYQELIQYMHLHMDSELTLLTCFSMAVQEQDLAQILKSADQAKANLGLLRKYTDILKVSNSQYAKDFATYVYRHSDGAKTKNWAFEQWLSLENEPGVKNQLLLDYIISDGREDLIPELKKITGSQWCHYYEQLLSALVKEGKTDLLITTMVMQGEKDRVIDEIKKSGRSDLILQKADYFYKIDKGFLLEQLQQNIERHLHAHIGYQSADYVLEVFSQLENFRLHSIVNDLFKMITKKFPERTYLIKFIKEANL